MTKMTMIESIRSAMDVKMETDEKVVVFGQDVGYFGGVFRCTQGLQEKYGTSRCFDTPISENCVLAWKFNSPIMSIRVMIKSCQKRQGYDTAQIPTLLCR